MASQADATDQQPGNELFAAGIGLAMYAGPAATKNLSDNAVAPAGGDQPHNNMQPYLTLNFCIALQGVFPPRS
jgi:microcystin-dependent protein